MYRHGRNTGVEGSLEDAIKVITALCRVVDPFAHLERHGNMGGNSIARAPDDLERNIGLPQVVAASALADDFFHRTPEVDVDDVEPGGDEASCALGEQFGLGSHQLPADRPFVFAAIEQMAVAPAVLESHEELVEHHFAERIRGAVSPGDQAHRPVAVAGKCGLGDWRGERNFADRDRRTG